MDDQLKRSSCIQGIASSNKTLKCEKCGRKFSSNYHLDRHTADVHQSKRLYTCSKCSLTFKRREHLGKHFLVHSETRPFKCNECDAQFKQKWHLKRHSSNVHGSERSTCDEVSSNDQIFACDYLQGIPPKQHFLRPRRSNQSDEEQYVCDECGNAYWSKNELSLHIVSHGDFYVTPLAELRYSFKRQYEKSEPRTLPSVVEDVFDNVQEQKPIQPESSSSTHRSSGDGVENISELPVNTQNDPQYKCSACGEEFCEHKLVVEHAKSCEQYALLVRKEKKAHLQGSNEGREHECSICHQSFARVSLLAKHLKAIHENMQ